jgi:hypothetical protein
MTSWLIPLAVIAALTAALALAFGVSSPKPIAVWQILGGVGIGVAWAASVTQAISPFDLISFLGSLLVATVAVVAGILLWRGRPGGIGLSLAAQAYQLAWVCLPSLQVGSTLGPTIGPRLTSTTISLSMGFYGRGGVSLAPTGSPYPLDITVNILALIAIVALLRMRGTSAARAAA